MDNIDGIPIVWDDADKLFGSLFPSGVAQGTQGFVGVQRDGGMPQYESPFGEELKPKDGSLLKLDKPISVFDDGNGFGFTYVYRIKICEDGTEVLNTYEKEVPKYNELVMICERTDNEKKTNFLGTFVLMKYGILYKKLVIDFYNEIPHQLASGKEGSVIKKLVNTFDGEIQDNYNILNNDYSVDVSSAKIRVATMAEIFEKSSTQKKVDKVFDLVNKGIDFTVEGLAGVIEKIKFTEKDYVPQEKDNSLSLFDYLALIRELENELIKKAIDYVIPDKVENFITNSFESVVKGLEETGEFIFNELPEGCKKILKKLYGVIQDVLTFFKESCALIKGMIEEAALLFKALLMGFVNGFLSLVEMLLKLIGWLIKPSNPNKSIGQVYKGTQSKLEFIEDLIDLICDKAGDFFSAVKNLWDDFSEEKMKAVLAVFVGKTEGLTPYHYAYFAGSFIFEVVISVVLVVFTGGASAIAEAANLAEKAIALIRVIARETLSVATMGVIDILQLFRILIVKFVQACAKGWEGFTKFLEKLLANKADDVAREEGRVLDDIEKNIDELIDEFGDLIRKGERRLKQDFEKELEKIIAQTEKREFINEAKSRYLKKIRKITESQYIKRYTQRIINKLKGEKAEEIFKLLFSGNKPSKAIKTSFTNRFIDNVLNGVAKEIKSGLVKNTKAFQRQLKKDIDIVFRNRGGITNVEWHFINGIEHDAINFLKETAQKRGVLDKIKIIIY